jgi:hypothetical protein
MSLYDGNVGTVAHVMGWLFGALQGEPPEARAQESEDAYYIRVCLKLYACAVAVKKRFWIVVDDLGDGANGPRLDPSIKRFMDHFALQMNNPAFGEWFRLILVHYPEGRVPTRWRGQTQLWDEDRPDPAEIDAKLLADFLSRRGEANERKLTRTDCEERAGRILADVEATLAAAALETQPRVEGEGIPSRMQAIHDRVLVELRLIAALPPESAP